MVNDHDRADVAVFIDFENVYVSVRDKLDANPNFESIMDRCEDLGRVVIARAYADWYRYPRITSALYANGIEPMYVPTYYYDREQGRMGRAIKNSVDMNLCVDAMRTLYTNPNISKFVLATGDRDFIPLVNAIRQQGKEVIVIGIGGAASAHLAQSADEFVFYEALVGKQAAALLPDQPRAKMPEKGRADEPATVAEPPRESTEVDIFDVLVRAIHLARERGYVCSFGSLKLLMKELTGGEFKENRYKDASGRPFAKFKDFVLEGERRGKVQVFTSGTVNEVFLPGEDPYKLSQFAQDIKEEPTSADRVQPPETTDEDEHGDTRLALSNGRRRRRRPRGGQRRAATPTDEEVTITEDEEVAAPEEQAVVEAADGVPEDVLAADFESEAQAEAVFEQLLERVEGEAIDEADTAAFQERMPDLFSEGGEAAAMQPEQPTEAPQLTEGETTAISSAAEGGPLIGRPFEPHEWQLLRDVVARFDRAVSFVTIHDALRDTRNQEQINRTNEELRTLVKQAINSGVLERVGKGTRVSYRLAAQPEQPEQGEQMELEGTPDVAPEASEAQEISDATLEPGETPDEIEQFERAAADVQATEAEAAQPPEPIEETDQTTRFEQAAAGEDTQPTNTLTEVSEQPDQLASEDSALVEQPEAVAPEIAADGTGTPEEAAPAATEAPAAEQPAPKPKRSTRRRKQPAAEATDEAAPTPVDEEPKKPRRRTRRTTTETSEPTQES